MEYIENKENTFYRQRLMPFYSFISNVCSYSHLIIKITDIDC